ncbi:hypothetical protein P3S67_018569 [Capsicum chacoense]
MLAAKTLPVSSPITKVSNFGDSDFIFPKSLSAIKANQNILSNPFQASCLKTSLESVVALDISCSDLSTSGGTEINQWLGKLGIKPNFLNGLRVADASTMEIVSMVLVGKVNKHLVSLINKVGATAVGLSGIDEHLLTARPSPNSELGFVGDIVSVDPTDKSGQSYNINADTTANELAAALRDEKLILLTDVAGILEDRNDPGSLVKYIDIKGVKKMTDDGMVAGGMIPKVSYCVRSMDQGVRAASIINGRLEHYLLLEILTDEGAGIMITG